MSYRDCYIVLNPISKCGQETMVTQRPDHRGGEVQNIFHITFMLVQTLSFTY